MEKIIALADDLAFTYDAIILAYVSPEFPGNEECAPEVMFTDFVKGELQNGGFRADKFNEILNADENKFTAEELLNLIETKGRELLSTITTAKIY